MVSSRACSVPTGLFAMLELFRSHQTLSKVKRGAMIFLMLYFEAGLVSEIIDYSNPCTG
jgi:hypothetical protein